MLPTCWRVQWVEVGGPSGIAALRRREYECVGGAALCAGFLFGSLWVELERSE